MASRVFQCLEPEEREQGLQAAEAAVKEGRCIVLPTDTVYGIGAGIFFIGYFLCEVPSNLLLEHIGARKTIARITLLWGLCCVAMMFVTTAGLFYLLRFLLGVFEAGFYPGVILFLTYWYPTERRAKVFGLFMSASAIASRPTFL